MHWSDQAVVLSIRKHGENSAVVRLFARAHGVFAGVIRGASSKANRGMLQPGNVVTATWNARLSEHLGSFKCELLEAHAAFIMQDAGKLSALASACAILESALPERHPYPRLYGLFKAFLATLKDGGDWEAEYVKFELELLAETGFGLDLTACAATGGTEDLVYVSPKSGRAVSAAAGEPYRDKLLKLPTFLLPSYSRKGRSPLPRSGGEGIPCLPLPTEREDKCPSPAEILAGMELTGYFLESWLLGPHRRKLPAARGRLMQYMEKAEQKQHGLAGYI